MPIQVAVIGGGSWGTTVAHLCAKNVPTTLWARRREVAEEIATSTATAVPRRLRPHAQPPRHLDASTRRSRPADVLVMGVPSHGFRPTAEELAEHLRPWVPVVSLTKGLEQGTRLRMTQVIKPSCPATRAGC